MVKDINYDKGKSQKEKYRNSDNLYKENGKQTMCKLFCFVLIIWLGTLLEYSYNKLCMCWTDCLHFIMFTLPFLFRSFCHNLHLYSSYIRQKLSKDNIFTSFVFGFKCIVIFIFTVVLLSLIYGMLLVSTQVFGTDLIN